jgi:energy-coupling factor transport system ATP-binding protein
MQTKPHDGGGRPADGGGRFRLSGARRKYKHASAPALRFDRVWHELRDGPAILKAVSLTIDAGQRVALMGRNGAGKSTLLRHAAGLMKPTRGTVSAGGRVGMLLQNPTDYLVHETVAEEATEPALRAVGLASSRRHPRELSVGEKQRLALAVVLGDPDEPPAVLCLDEPTRGLDRRLKTQLGQLLCGLPTTILVATHDPEFVAQFATRVVLLGDGAPIADGAPAQALTGGSYFVTETSRIVPGALTPVDALAALQREEVPA